MACTGDLNVAKISRTECIGNSLVTINRNFSNLDIAICNASNLADERYNLIESAVFSQVMNVRLSLSPTNPVTTTDTTSNTIYLHPYKGTTVSLWNVVSSKWETKTFNSTISEQLTGCAANANYDVYLYHDGTKFGLEMVAWTSDVVGTLPPLTDIKNGVPVKVAQPNKRLIGCLRTTDACMTELSFGKTPVSGGSHPKLFLWNLYNRVPVSFSILDSGGGAGVLGEWATTVNGDTAGSNGPFERFGSSSNNKISFISRDDLTLNLNTSHYVDSARYFYFIHSLDLETPTVAQYLTKTPGVPIFQTFGNQTMSHSYHTVVPSGYHFIQLATMTNENQPVKFSVWTNDKRSGGTAGYIAEF